jgi:hypothetical protein
MCLGLADCQPQLARFIASAMREAEKKSRLAEALRANLRRRKAQARAQDAAAPDAQSEENQIEKDSLAS